MSEGQHVSERWGGPPPATGIRLDVKLWHVVMLLLVQFAGMMVEWGMMRQQVSDLSDRVSRIEQSAGSAITRPEFESWHVEMLERMNRLEQEILERNLSEK